MRLVALFNVNSLLEIHNDFVVIKHFEKARFNLLIVITSHCFYNENKCFTRFCKLNSAFDRITPLIDVDKFSSGSNEVCRYFDENIVCIIYGWTFYQISRFCLERIKKNLMFMELQSQKCIITTTTFFSFS